jgi:hypothetical protein
VTAAQPAGAVTWGAAVLEDDSYTYVYGVEDLPWHKYLHVARCLRGGLTGQWEFWTGSGWSTDATTSARVLDGVSDQLTVWRDGATYRLLSQGNFFSRDVSSYTSATPAGPWSAGHVAYTIPDPGGNLFTYNAVAHPEFTNASGLLVSYSVNSNDGADLYRDVTNYRPRFVRLPGSSLDG